MSMPRLIIALLVLGALIIFLVQNTSPALSLVFLGGQTLAFPLAFWLLGAIALGAMTTLFLAGVASLGAGAPQRSRRRWQVRPEEAPTTAPPAPAARSAPASPPEDAPRRDRAAASSQTQSTSPTRFSGSNPSSVEASDDWQDWQERGASQWEDWGQPGEQAKARGRGPQKQPQQAAEESLNDIAQGWDEPAQSSRDRPQEESGSVEDTLDDIAAGWGDWQQPLEAAEPSAEAEETTSDSSAIYELRRDPESVQRSGSSYSYRYRSAHPKPTDNVYGPPDDAAEADEDWTTDEADTEDWQTEASDHDMPQQRQTATNGVYDADYRVIIPPSRPLDADAEDPPER